MSRGYQPHCRVKAGSRTFDYQLGRGILLEASVELTTDKSGEGVVTVFDPGFVVVDSFVSGTGLAAIDAQFWFGWGPDLGEPVFAGTITRAEWVDSKTTLRFHDKSAKMKAEKKSRYINKKTDLQTLKQLAEENGLTFVGPDNAPDSEAYESIMQDGRSDWELALKIAERAGLKLFVRGDTLYAKRAGVTGDAVTAIKYGTDFDLLRGFNLSYKTPENKRGRPQRVEVRGRGRGGRRLTGTEQTGDRGVKEVVVKHDLPKQTVSAATRNASGRSHRRREYAFEHHLQLLPDFRQRLQLNDSLELNGMGRFFSGKYLITQLGYRFRPTSLTIDLQVGRDLP